MSKWKVTKVVEVSASHQLDLPHDSPCNRVHGHNYRIAVTISSEDLTDGMVVDFALVSLVVKDFMDHQHLNDLLQQPTVERLCEALVSMLGPVLRPTVRVERIVVNETGSSECEYIP